MKRFIIAVLLTLLVCTSAFAKNTYEDGFGDGGFGKIKWGDKPSQHKPSKDLALNRYRGLNEQHYSSIQITRIGRFDISNVVYFFDEQEGLYRVTMDFKDNTDLEQLLLECSRVWGKKYTSWVIEKSDNCKNRTIQWKGQKTGASIHLDTCVNCGNQMLVLFSMYDEVRWQRIKSRNEQR